VPRSSLALTALVAAASLTTLLTLLTVVVPDWIEEIFEVEPDGGSGSLEWLLVGALLLVSVALWAGAWRVHRRRSGPATAAGPGA
jgi:hypothetical protein